MSYTTRYRYSFLEKTALLISFFLVILALVCLMFLTQPGPFYERLLPIVIKKGTGGTLTFKEVKVPSYYEPHFENLFLSLPGLPTIKAGSISLAFNPQELLKPNKFITQFLARDLTVSSMPRLTLETASIESVQVTTGLRAYSFSGTVDGHGLGDTTISGILPLVKNPQLTAKVISRNIDIAKLAKRWHLKWNPTGVARFDLELTARGNAKKEWEIFPKGTCHVENLCYKGKNFTLKDAEVVISFNKDFIDLKLVTGVFTFGENDPVGISGTLHGDATTISLKELLLKDSHGGKIKLSARNLLNQNLSSATVQWLPQWQLLQTIVANLEEDSHELSLVLQGQAIPAKILASIPGIKSIDKGLISASIKGNCTLKDDGFYELSPSGNLTFDDVGIYLNSGIVVTDTSGEVKMKDGKIEIVAREGTIYEPRLCPLSGNLLATWSQEEGFAIKSCQLKSVKKARLFPFDVNLEIKHDENQHILKSTISHKKSSATIKLQATRKTTAKSSQSTFSLQLAACPLPLLTNNPLPGFMNDWTLDFSGEALWEPIDIDVNLESFLKALAANGELHIQDLLISDSYKNKVAYMTNYEAFKWKDDKAISGSVALNVCNNSEIKATLDHDLKINMKALDLEKAIVYLSDSTPLEKLLGQLAVNVELCDFVNRVKDNKTIKYKTTISIADPGYEQWHKAKTRISRLNVKVPPTAVSISSDDSSFVLRSSSPPTKSDGLEANESPTPVELWVDHNEKRTKSVVKNFAATWHRLAPVEHTTISSGTVRYNHDFLLPPDFFKEGHSKKLSEEHYLKANIEMEAYHSNVVPAKSFGAQFLSDITGSENKHLTLKTVIDTSMKDNETVSLSANLDGGDSYMDASIKRSGSKAKFKMEAEQFPLGAFGLLNIPSGALVTASATASHRTENSLLSLIENAGEGRFLRALQRAAKSNMILNVKTLNVARKESTVPEISILNPFTLTSNASTMIFADFALLIGGHKLAVDGSLGYDGRCNVSLISEKVPLASVVELLRLPVTSATNGFLTADIKLRGSLPFPGLAGELNLDNGVFSFPYLDQKLYFPSLKILNNSRGSSVRASGLKFGDSPLSLIGTISSGDSGELKIGLSGNNLKATWQKSILNKIDVDSSILSNEREQKAEIKVSIGDGIIRIPLSTLAALGNSNDEVTNPDDLTLDRVFASLSRIYNDVDTSFVFEIPDSIRLKNALFDTRISGTAAFTVSDQSPKFTVNLKAKSGTLKIHRHTFKVSIGTVLYEQTDTQKHSSISLVAHCRESNYNISFSVSGTLEDPILSFSSVPPMAQGDIVKLLLLGKQDFASTQGQTTSEGMSGVTGDTDLLEATAIDYLATGMLSSLLFTDMKDIGTLSVRTDEDVSSFLRLEKAIGRDLLVTFERLLNDKYDHVDAEDTNIYVKWGIDEHVTLEGKTGGSDGKTDSGSYVGMFRSFRFR